MFESCDCTTRQRKTLKFIANFGDDTRTYTSPNPQTNHIIEVRDDLPQAPPMRVELNWQPLDPNFQ